MAVENILEEDDDVESEKEHDALGGAESSSKNSTNKIPKPSLGETIVLLGEASQRHTTQNIGLGNKSKVDFTLSLTADSAIPYDANGLMTLMVALNVLMKIVLRII